MGRGQAAVGPVPLGQGVDRAEQQPTGDGRVDVGAHVALGLRRPDEAGDDAVELLRLALDRALDALFAVTDEPAATTGPAIDRLEHVVRGSVRVLAAELPFVTLLLRVRGNSAVERAALQRRREFDRLVTDLVRTAEEEGSVRPDVDPAVTSRLLFGTVNSLTEWYRPGGGLSAGALADAVVAVTFSGLRAAP